MPRRGRRKDHGRLDTIPGFLPAPGVQLKGCVFAPRCGLAGDLCRNVEPDLFDLGGRRSRCHYHEQAPNLPRVTPADLPTASVIDRAGTPVLRTQDLAKTYGSGERKVRALAGVSLELWPGETLGLVGESGSGKTTFARLLLGLVAPDDPNSITLDGKRLPGKIDGRSPIEIKALQIVFQNPDSALNRSRSVKSLVGRALAKLARVPRSQRMERLLALTRAVRLADRYLPARPRQLSGGLKQRVAIARAFAGDPRIVVCDEPTSALDVSVQAAILNLLADLQAERKVSYIFISHDLGTVRYLSDRIAVLYLGRLMEIGPAERVFAAHIILIPRPCSPPCRRSTARTATACACRARFRARSIRRRAASSTPAARATSARSARPRSRRSSRQKPVTRSAVTSPRRNSVGWRSTHKHWFMPERRLRGAGPDLSPCRAFD